MGWASGQIWFRGSAMPAEICALPSLWSAFQGSRFSPRLAFLMVPKWLQKFHTLHLYIMLSQRENRLPGSSFRRSNFFLIYLCLRQWVSLGILRHISILESIPWLFQNKQGTPWATVGRGRCLKKNAWVLLARQLVNNVFEYMPKFYNELVFLWEV